MKRWILGARLRTLPAAVVPVLLGTATSVSVNFSWWKAVGALLVAISLQVGANYANDYGDGVRGLDGGSRVGPQRLVGSGLATPASVRRAALIAFLVAAISGAILSLVVQPWLLLIGVTSIAAAWFYTAGRKPYGYKGLGEISVFFFFGPVATVGSSYLQIKMISGLALLAGVATGLLASSLLVVNNLRDRESDLLLGKKTLAVKLGDNRTRILYVFLVTAGCFFGGLCAFSRFWAVLSCVALVAALRQFKTVLKGAEGTDLIQVLNLTGRIQLLFGILLTFGIIVS